MEIPSGKCATCRYLASRVYRYQVGPWEVGFYCLKRIPQAPHARECLHHEREAGAD